MSSIRARLLLILTLTTSLVWLCAVAWIYFSTHAHFERVLDTRLAEAARMVSSLASSPALDAREAAELGTEFTEMEQPGERQISCQIWSVDGRLVGQSEGAPSARLSDHSAGFADTSVEGEQWRVYATYNEALGIRVLVADNLRVRQGLVRDVVTGLLLPALVIFPILMALIWVSVGRGLRPLEEITRALAGRAATDLAPIEIYRPPRELRPVVGALNSLFGRVSAAREREKAFTAFAAHELRTPLAGLKTQAQVAQATEDPQVLRAALDRVVQSVDRSARLVSQLLAIARLEAEDAALPRQVVPLQPTLERTASEFAAAVAEKHLTLRYAPELATASLSVSETLFTAAVRNVLENAINHSPRGGEVDWSIEHAGGAISLVLRDQGKGIPEEELPRVTQRFYRLAQPGLGAGASAGTGLGLAIAEVALSRAGGSLVLRNRASGGLEAVLTFPCPAIQDAGESGKPQG